MSSTVRLATSADLDRVGRIWYTGAGGGGPDVAPLRGVPSLYQHELDTGELWVLDEEGEVVGFASVVQRAGIAFLADLFVAPDARSGGRGQRLLESVLPRDDDGEPRTPGEPHARPLCTVSSNDPRALPLYIRHGMRPRWPLVQLRLSLPHLSRLDVGPVRVVEADIDDPAFGHWDTAIGGRDRPQDRRYWLERRGGIPLWCKRDGETIGYALAQTVSDDVLDRADVISLGPIGVRERSDAAACVAAVTEWARTRERPLRLSLLGPHPALVDLLRAGARIASVETFCCTTEPDFVDPVRYVPSGADLF